MESYKEFMNKCRDFYNLKKWFIKFCDKKKAYSIRYYPICVGSFRGIYKNEAGDVFFNKTIGISQPYITTISIKDINIDTLKELRNYLIKEEK